MGDDLHISSLSCLSKQFCHLSKQTLICSIGGQNGQYFFKQLPFAGAKNGGFPCWRLLVLLC